MTRSRELSCGLALYEASSTNINTTTHHPPTGSDRPWTRRLPGRKLFGPPSSLLVITFYLPQLFEAPT